MNNFNHPLLDIDENSKYLGSEILEIFNQCHPKTLKSMAIANIIKDYPFHLPNIDGYETFPIYHINGQFIMAFDSNLDLLVNNLDLEDENSKNIYDYITSKVEDLKHSEHS